MIYLDNSATTKPCKEAVEAMTAALIEKWGNPSALYSFGIDTAHEMRLARNQVAAALGAEPDRVFFTSGGTEADNWAIFGAAKRFGKKNKHIITTAVEHHAILNCAKELEAQIKETVEEYKVEVIEIKSAVGKLDNEVEFSQQFFCGVLVRSNSDALPQAATVTLGKIFDEAGCHPWHKSEIDNDHLVNKKLAFDHTDFSSGDYYLIWGYTSSLTQKLTDKLSEIELHTLPAGWKPADGARESENNG
jgi:hypothetical protein